MNRRHFLTAALVFPWLMACGRNEPIHQPTPLKTITPNFRLESLWSHSVGGMGRRDVPGLGIVESGEQLFAAAGNGGLICVKTSGELLWQKKVADDLLAGPAVSDVAELVLAGTAKGDVVALSIKTGNERWRVNVGTEVLSVFTGSGRVFVRTADGKLMALEVMDGKALWVLDHDMPALSVRGMAKPLPLANAMVLGWEDGFVETVLQTSGERVWDTRVALSRGRTDIERMVDVQSSVLTDGQRIFAGATNSKVVALDVQSGSQLWRNDTSTWVDMALGERRLFVIAEDDTLKALSTESGRVLWMQDGLKHRRLSKAVAWGDWVVVADMEGAMHVLNAADGHFVARQESAVKDALVDGLALTDRRMVTLDVHGQLSLWQVVGQAGKN